ncbi:MAG: isochorismatase family protein, partial [Solirubrobacteraceae bacterium]
DTGIAIDADGYSAFESDLLRELLREEEVVAVTVVGLATDYCVRHTAADALREGLIVTIESEAIRGIDAGDSREALAELAGSGAVIRD